ncbi:MAG: hypothetical protein HC838_00010 [Spirulinaceae cyanobacterium RM2_2_10]|nr:hypothetical protein [Spirulinaceae cyanobacterium RM2_2_10]
MGQPQYSVEDLIANIKRRCAVPTSQLTYTPEDFTLLASDEMQDIVVPLIMSTREEMFVDFYDIPTPADRIIPFPPETVGNKIRSVCYVQQSSPLILINLPRIDLDVVAGVGFSNLATLAGFYIQGNDLVLYPNTSVPVGTMIRIYFYRRTLVLADPSSYGRVVSVDPNTNTIVLDFMPLAWGIGTLLNAVSQTTPFRTVNDEMEIVNVSSPSVILNNVDDISVGDYISQKGFSAIPQIPIEAHPYLAQLTAAKALEGLGDRAGEEAAAAKAEKMKSALLVMISQRVDGSVKKIVNPSGGLRFNATIGRWGGGWGGSTY